MYRVAGVHMNSLTDVRTTASARLLPVGFQARRIDQWRGNGENWVVKRRSAIAEVEIDQLRYKIVIEVHHGLGNPRVPLRDRQGGDRG